MLLELPLHMGRESCHSRLITIKEKFKITQVKREKTKFKIIYLSLGKIHYNTESYKGNPKKLNMLVSDLFWLLILKKYRCAIWSIIIYGGHYCPINILCIKEFQYVYDIGRTI